MQTSEKSQTMNTFWMRSSKDLVYSVKLFFRFMMCKDILFLVILGEEHVCKPFLQSFLH